MTGIEALAAARQRLEAAGIPGADEMRLMAHAFGWTDMRYAHYPELGKPLPPDVAGRFEAGLAARLRRQPVSQIVGHRQFWKHRFRVTPDVLDPRPETEALVAEALSQPFRSVLDLGTGSGCILLSLLAERPGARGIGVDISPAALGVAAANRADLGLGDRADLAEGSWFAPVTGRFELIVSNPPYIAKGEIASLAPEVRDWEPHLALSPGGDGLAAYRAIAAGLPGHLAEGGRVVLEIGPGQGGAVVALLAAQGLVGIRVLPDLDGRDRVVVAHAP